MDDLAPAPDAPVEPGETGEPRVPLRLFALKDGDTFLVADAYGDILGSADGLFLNDTRLLSHFRLLLGGRPPSLLSAAVAQDNVFFTSNTSNRRGGHAAGGDPHRAQAVPVGGAALRADPLHQLQPRQRHGAREPGVRR